MSQSKTSAENFEESSDVSFVKRWSRLKQETRQDINQDIKNDTADNKAVAPAISNEERQPAVETLTDKDMPDIDSLTPASDYTDFLSPGVSEELRKLALRKLFSSEVFNIRDGLDEYDDDFTQFEALGDVVTSDMKHQLELEAQRKAEQLLQDEQPLSDNDAAVEVEAIDKTNSADDNKIAAHDLTVTDPPLDETETKIAEDVIAKNTAAYSFTTDGSASMDSEVNHDLKQKLDKSDPDSEVADVQAKTQVNQEDHYD